MKKTYSQSISYDIIYKDETIRKFDNKACFYLIPYNIVGGPQDYSKVKNIVIRGTECEVTIKYRDFYLQYLIDALKLKEASFTDKTFTFKAFSCRKKTLLVCTLTRVLFENFGSSGKIDNLKDILIPLKTGKSKYRNKLKRFCDFYSRIQLSIERQGYFPNGHFFRPDKTKIRSTQDFVKAKTISSVNEFFEN